MAKPLHLMSHQQVPILVGDSLDDSPREETRLMLTQGCPTVQGRSLTASITDTALVPALCIIPKLRETKHAKTHCFWEKKLLIEKIMVF